MASRFTISYPKFSVFGKEMNARRKVFYETAMLLVVADIISGIKKDIDITGGSFPALEPETVLLKGHAKALVDKGLLTDEFTYQKLNKYLIDSAEITVKPVSSKSGKKRDTPRNKAGVQLQIDGVDSKSGKKFFNFFGVSKDAADGINALFDVIVQECLEAIPNGQ
jgi:hypothetical protein